MQFWNEIINTALLGTARKQVVVDMLPPGLREAAGLVVAQPATEAEEQFLQLAALSFNFRQSGVIPLRREGKPVPEVTPETLPYCSAAATQVLKDILTKDNSYLLAYWLDRCCQARQLAPPELVPTLLNLATNNRKGLQQAVVAVCGRRGEWLSRLNPAWASSAAVDDETLWQTGTPDQRKTVLWRMRQQDPARTRNWLQQTWPQENANSRTEMLKQLDGTVEPDDEPWLQSLLADKSQKVKDEALRLLKQLPGSALVQQYQDLLRPLIFLKKEKALLGMFSKTVFHIQLPAVPEKGDYVPGIEKLSNDKSYTDGEFIVFQLMQAVPPGFWEQHFGQGPADVLSNFAGRNEKYLPAFVKATVQFRDRRWALAYLEYRDIFYEELLALLPSEEAEAYCLRNFKQYADPITQQAKLWTREWSLPLAKEILAHTARQPFQYGVGFYQATIHLIPVAVTDLLESLAPADLQHQKLALHLFDQLESLLLLKQQIINAFKE
jgi:hypothetical protein